MTMTSKHIEPGTPEAAVSLLRRLATRAMGLTGADIERIVRQARLKARREKRSIRYEDLEDGIRMDRPQVPYDLRWRFAIHESGHAVVHHALRLGPIHGLNIDAPGGGGYSQLGFTASGSDTLGYREDMLAMLMAGGAPEQIGGGQVSLRPGGAHDSALAPATDMALPLARVLGIWEAQPPPSPPGKEPNAPPHGQPQPATPPPARLEKAFARAVEIVNENRDKLDALTNTLFDAQALDGEAVRRLLKDGDRPPSV